MGHACHVGYNRLALDILAQRNAQLALHVLEDIRLHQLFQADRVTFLVGHFDAYIVRAGDRGFDAHTGCGQGQGQVVGQPSDLADFDLDPFQLAGHRAFDVAGLDQVLRYRWAFVGAFKVSRYAKKLKRLLNQAALLADQIVAVAAAFPVLQDIGQAR